MKRAQQCAAAIVVTWLLVALARRLCPRAANAISLPGILALPGSEAWLGRDDLGRSVLARLMAGAGLSLEVALVVVSISALFGTTVGLVAAWFGGWLDGVLLRLTDIFLAFPGILLAIALAGALGPGIANVMTALSVVGWVGFARLARAQALSIKQRDHVVVAHALGVAPPRIVLRHVLPLIAGPLIVEASFASASVIVAEAGLSFLGLGVQAPTPSWGSMIRDGARYLLVAPHLVLMPGLALASLVVAINLIGDGLRDRLDPRRA